MRGFDILVVSSLVLVVAAWLVIDGVRPVTPTLALTIRRLHRDAVAPRTSERGRATWLDRLGTAVDRRSRVGASSERVAALRLIGRTPTRHAGMLALASIVGLVVPSLGVGVLQATGVVRLGVVAPLGVGLVAAVLAPC